MKFSVIQTLLATCRAGNVIGGGDWAQDRLMTDIMISVSHGKKVSIRNPKATRPWQHVLEPLSGYLLIGQKLLEEKVAFADAWNFGPSDEGSICVEEVVKHVKKHWSAIDYEIQCEYPALQTIVYHPKVVNAVFCPVFKYLTTKFLSMVDSSKFFFYTRKKPEDLRKIPADLLVFS